MPQRDKPLKARPTVEDESTGKPAQHHGKHRDNDEGLPAKADDEKGGLSKQSGDATGVGET